MGRNSNSPEAGRDSVSGVAISHIHKDACSLAQAKGLPSLIYHEPAIEVRFVRGSGGRTGILTMRVLASFDEKLARQLTEIFGKGIAADKANQPSLDELSVSKSTSLNKYISTHFFDQL
jgi:hypothetical protein